MRLVGTFIIFVSVVLALSFVSAECENSDQIIMALSDTVNAHGEVWDGSGDYGEGSNPGVKICYEDYFNPTFEGESVHECTGDNLLVKLTAETNAHVGSGDIPLGVAGNESCWENTGEISAANNGVVFSLVEFDGMIYGSFEASDSNSVYRYNGADWISAGDPSDIISPLIVWDGLLYGGANTGKIYSYDGSTWTEVGSLLSSITAFGIFDSEVYASTYNGKVYAYTEGPDGAFSWNEVGSFAGTRVYAFTAFDGALYASTGSGIYKYDGSVWTSVGGYYSQDLKMWDGQLYSVTSYNVYRHDGGNSWTAVDGFGGVTAGCSALEVWGGDLYVGCGNPGTFSGSVHRYDGGTTWTEVGDMGLQAYVSELVVWNNNLYAGKSGNGFDDAEIYRYNSGCGAGQGVSGGGNYSVSVCHKGLSECEIMGVGESCAEGKSAIVYLDGLENSHLSLSSEDYAVCCKGGGIILPPIAGPTSCFEFDNQDDCEAGKEIAVNDQLCLADDPNSCECVWNSTGDICEVSWSDIVIGDCTYRCIIETQEVTECVQEEKIVSLNARLTPVSGVDCATDVTHDSCKSGSKTIACRGGEIKLGFFGMWHILASVAAIAGIYFLLRRYS